MNKCTFNCALGVPLIGLQILVLSYFYGVLLVNYPRISDIAYIHLTFTGIFITLAIASLIQTYRTSPGVFTRDILEQVKMTLTLDTQKETEIDIEDPDEKIEQAAPETSRGMLEVDELNNALLKRVNTDKNRGKNIEMVQNESVMNNSTVIGHSIKELPYICRFKHCKPCDLIQPPRVFHCDVCNACVMRLDHHCFWMGNCIGLYNFKHFNLFLLYFLLNSFYITLSITSCFTTPFIDILDIIFNSLHIGVVLVFSIAIGICLLILFIMNLKFLWSNQTMLELQEYATISPYKKKGGAYQNIKAMLLFDRLWQAFLPINVRELDLSEFIVPSNL